MAVAALDIAWLAGILEGEACFCIGSRKVGEKTYKRITIQLVMTDKDIVQRVAGLFGTRCCDMPWRDGSVKPTYRVACTGDRAAGWMMTVYRFMGERRQQKIKDCLLAWRRSPGRTNLQRATARLEVA